MSYFLSLNFSGIENVFLYQPVPPVVKIKSMNRKWGRLLRNCPVGNFKEEPDCGSGNAQSNTKVSTNTYK